ncbi:MAG: NAD(P)-dependent oxidoreductase [Pseudomonadota bacterium]
MSSLLIFGLGYTSGRLADRLRGEGWRVTGTSRDGRDGTIALADRTRLLPEIAAASHILSSVPPEGDADPVLTAYGDVLTESPAWLGYLSSTGVYGDARGGWVDESAPIAGRRAGRATADGAWLALGARIFRLPGIYGPGRSALDRVAAGRAHRVDVPDQVFSRVHVDDIVSGIIAALSAPPGAYNLADDAPCGQNDVIAFAATLLGRPAPPFVDLATLSPPARAFYAENRRVANGKAKRVLGWRPAYPDYRFGLRALSAMTSPIIASAAPAPASSDQR